jgi:phosphatidylinositol glycan class B
MKFSVNSVIIALSIAIFTITAYNSTGFFHADEHYQLIEFAGLKAGWNNPSDLVWEYHAKIRPTLQPTIAFGLISTFKFFGVTDSYTISFLLREITGLLMIFALVFFFKNTKQFIQSSKQPQTNKFLEGLYLGFLLLIWYIPFLGVRFSSETWSTIFLLLAMGSFCSENKTQRKTLLVGLLFGISFLFRFQIAFALVGFGIHQLIFGKEKLKTSLLILSGFSIIVMLGVFIDHWFYSEWVFTPWEYFWTFFKNDVLNNKTSNFGESPWDYYFDQLFHLPTKFIGTLIFISLAATLVFKRKSVFIWMFLTFLILHMLISHKEERFLFPIAFLFPLFFMQLFQLLIDFIPKKNAVTLISLTSLGILITSIIGLPILATSSAGIGRNGTTQFIHTHFKNKPVHLISLPYSNPYAPWFLNERFYLDKNVTFTHINNFEELNSQLLKKDTINLLITSGFFLVNYPQKENIQKLGFKLIHQPLSDYHLKMNRYVHGMDVLSVSYLYQLKK